VADDTEVVGIDEGQFFDADLPAACNTLADSGKRVIVAGLDQDYLGRRSSRCRSCWRSPNTSRRRWRSASSAAIPANHTQRLVASSDRVLVGASGLYEARCRHCFDPHLAAGIRDSGVGIQCALGFRLIPIPNP
jgi:thymidine kinase